MSKRRVGFHNSPPAKSMPEDAPQAVVKAEFAKRLNQRMIDKGWNQSELAARASKHTNDGKFGRYSVSCYIRGRTLPRPDHLHALAKALDVKPADLLPTRGVPNSEERLTPLHVKDSGDGMAWLHVNQQVPWTIALKIIDLLKSGKA